MKNRYLIFGGDSYYARGGGCDFIGSEPTYGIALDRAERLMKTRRAVQRVKITIDWSHVFDTETNKIIASFGTRPFGSAPEDAPEEDKA